MATEQQVQIAAKLYDARRILRSLMGENYQLFVGRWINLLRVHQTANGFDTLHAAMDLMQSSHDERAQLWLMAATVELIEPDDQTPSLPTAAQPQETQ